MNKKQIVRAVLFLALLAVILGMVTNIFVPKWISGTSVSRLSDEFYSLPKDSVDVGIIGSSQLVNGISCARLIEEHGISAFSCATGEQPALVGWFYLLELNRTQHVNTVIYDMSMLYEPEEESRFRKTLDSAPMSINKMKMILERCKSDESSDFFSYVFPILKYHTRWTSLKRDDFGYDKEHTNMFYGNIMGGGVNRKADLDKISVDNEMPDESVKMDENELLAFRKIADFCKENNIDLILIKTPKTTWESAKTIGCQALADEYGLPYIDFNRLENLEAMGFDVTNDMWNQDHLNVRGTDKLTDFMAEYLKTRKQFDDFRLSDDYDAEKIRKYKIDHANKMLQTSIHPEEYLDLLKEERFEVMLQKTGDFSAGFSASLQEKMEALGVTTDLSSLDGLCYIAQLRDGMAVCELAQTDPIVTELTLADDKIGAVSSNVTEEVLMSVSGKKNAYSIRGLNMLVYDKQNHEIADLATFYVNEEGVLDIMHDVQEEEEQ